MSYGKATPYFPVIDLLKALCPYRGPRRPPHHPRAKVTGQVLTLDEALQRPLPALLALLDALPDDSPFWQPSTPRSAASAPSRPLKRLLLRESQVQPLLPGL